MGIFDFDINSEVILIPNKHTLCNILGLLLFQNEIYFTLLLPHLNALQKRTKVESLLLLISLQGKNKINILLKMMITEQLLFSYK